MSTRPDSAATRPPRSRRSIAHVPRSKITSGLDKENATAGAGAAPLFGNTGKVATKDKKSRSKSLGPGGLDALQNSHGNRRKSTASFPLKSILKPTVPVSPVRNIPSFEETRRRTPGRNTPSHANAQNTTQGNESLLIDFDTPAQPSTTDIDNTSNPFDTFNATSAIRDEMAATKERDEEERRERERQNVLEKREARRKSMANRRVSFAPEATLHTWNVVEIPDDQTSSSAANSTRRASSIANSRTPQQPAPAPEKDVPSSPADDADSDFGFSPVRQQDIEQMRSGGQIHGDQDIASSSPFSRSSAASEETGVQSIVDGDDDDNTSGSDDGFDAESTAMSMDDMTAHSASTMQSDVSSSSSASAKLNEALRQAAREAGTQALDEEGGEVSMEIADDEITGAFQPWIKKGQHLEWDDISARFDQENRAPPAEASEANYSEPDSADGDEDLSMDVTNAIGRILGKKSPGRRQSAVRRKSSGQETNYDDQTMEMTAMVGGISQQELAKPEAGDNDDEEMTMEFTAAVGGLLNKPSQEATQMEQPASSPPKSDAMDAENGNGSDDGMDMDMTGAIGGILPSGFESQDKAQAKRLMELETESGQLDSSPFQETVHPSPAKSPAKSPLSFKVAAVAENGSPSLANVRRSSRRSSAISSASSLPGTPQSTTRKRSPSKKPATPTGQSTPQLKPTTPSKTPPSANVSYRSASPKQLFQPEIQQSAERRKSLRQSIFEKNSATGQSTPRIVLQPREARRSSGLGIDKEGLGSPRVAALLDNRPSLGEHTPQFVPNEPSRSGVRFEDPLKMQADEERDRQEEELREDGHIPADGEGAASLRDMISSLSPKKNKIGSRKSLHVGAARGILGKRPAELDLDEEEAENSPKRLRGHDVSPVKGVKLPAPVNHETNRRSTRSPARRSRNSSPLKGSTTPTRVPRSASKTTTTPLKEGIDALHIASDPQQPDPEEEEEEEEDTPQDAANDDEPIQLQEFLNMTNIHFMELTTTKRRHTTAPGSAAKRLARLSQDKSLNAGTAELDDCVAAGFCTVPMLELYQHSCRELKSYISEGRQVIRSIEAETFADNPPLFQEYVNAPPDIRVIMDNQFRNVKTHARLLSKATWYEWRMKLLEGLKEGLDRHVEDMKADDELLSTREALLNSVVPPLVEKHASLEEEASNLQLLVEEMESCDQDELRDARKRMSDIDDEIEAKKRELRELQEEAEHKMASIETGTEMRDEYLAQIQEAERVKEECRGWSARDISELKASVRLIERQTGWAITSVVTDPSSGSMLAMLYRGQLQIKFCPGAFATNTSNDTDKKSLPLELTFVKGKQISSIASLVLQSLQRHLATIKQFTITPKELLRFISSTWDSTIGLENEAHMLEFCGVTRLTLSDNHDSPLSLRARCTILGNAAASSTLGRKGATAQTNSAKRIDVDFTVTTRVIPNNETCPNIGLMDFDIAVLATKVYGFGTGNKFGLSEKEIQSILGKEIGRKGGEPLGNGMWCKAVQNLTGAVF